MVRAIHTGPCMERYADHPVLGSLNKNKRKSKSGGSQSISVLIFLKKKQIRALLVYEAAALPL